MRLQPMRYEGVSLARSSGSLTARAMLALASFSTRPSSFGCLVKAPTWSSRMPQKDAPAQGGRGRERAVEPALGGADRAVHARHDPGGRALEEGELPDLALDLGHDLDGGGAGADHGDALAAQVVVVVPARRVEDLAGEVREARDVGDLRVGERSGGGDEDLGAEAAAAGLDLPPQRLRVPPRLQHLVVQAEVRTDPEGVGDVLQVGADVALPGEGPGPVRVGREGEGVEVGGDVAGAAGVAVVAPGAAHGVGPLQDDEVGDPLAAQPDGGPDAAESRPDHRHPYVLVLRHAASRAPGHDSASNHWHSRDCRAAPYRAVGVRRGKVTGGTT
ncbi:hypothetical protein STANM337S_03614 [Streptomyces tanashiensis]